MIRITIQSMNSCNSISNDWKRFQRTNKTTISPRYVRHHRFDEINQSTEPTKPTEPIDETDKPDENNPKKKKKFFEKIPKTIKNKTTRDILVKITKTQSSTKAEKVGLKAGVTSAKVELGLDHDTKEMLLFMGVIPAGNSDQIFPGRKGAHVSLALLQPNKEMVDIYRKEDYKKGDYIITNDFFIDRIHSVDCNTFNQV